MIILAIVIAVLEGIRVFDNAALPSKIAQLVVGSRDAKTDPATLMATTEGQQTLFYLFVGATMPIPRIDRGCDNSLIPPWAYNSSSDPNLIVYVPLGSNTAITTLADRSNCLNPPPIPPAAPTDAHFLVSPQGAPAGQPGDASPTISMGGAPVRLHGNWFIIGNGSAGQQTLRLQYVDWDGDAQFAWLYHDNAGYHFLGATVDDDTTTIDSDTCQDDGTCWKSDQIQYIGSDGTGYSASVEEFQSSTGQPSYAPSQPVEASPVTFDAEDFAPGELRWQPHLHLAVPAPRVRLDRVRPHRRGRAGAPVVHRSRDRQDRDALVGEHRSGQGRADRHGPARALGHDGVRGQRGQRGPDRPGAARQPGNRGDASDVARRGQRCRRAGRPQHRGQLRGRRREGDQGRRELDPLLDPDITRIRLGSQSQWSILATHTYAQPGIYYGTYTVSDWGGGTDFDTFTVEVTGAQQITFPAVSDQTYGDQLKPATGSMLSGVPVTYDAGPDSVCQATGDGQAVQLVGVGECTITAHQAADPPMFLAASPVARTFDVTPAPLTIKPRFEDKVYGAENPVFSALYTRLVNGDTPEDITGLVFNGPPAGADVGDYAVTASGASNPNYDISYAPGTLRIKRAEASPSSCSTTAGPTAPTTPSSRGRSTVWSTVTPGTTSPASSSTKGHLSTPTWASTSSTPREPATPTTTSSTPREPWSSRPRR